MNMDDLGVPLFQETTIGYMKQLYHTTMVVLVSWSTSDQKDELVWSLVINTTVTTVVGPGGPL